VIFLYAGAVRCRAHDAFRMSGWLYLVVAIGLSFGFSWYGWRLWRLSSDALARKTFRFSLIHLRVSGAAGGPHSPCLMDGAARHEITC
jgi:protoheme IX farnesyltransferase